MSVIDFFTENKTVFIISILGIVGVIIYIWLTKSCKTQEPLPPPTCLSVEAQQKMADEINAKLKEQMKELTCDYNKECEIHAKPKAAE